MMVPSMCHLFQRYSNIIRQIVIEVFLPLISRRLRGVVPAFRARGRMCRRVAGAALLLRLPAVPAAANQDASEVERELRELLRNVR